MLRTLMATTAALILGAGVALADPNGGVDDQNPAESRNPNDDRSGPGASGPGGGANNNLFEAPIFAPAEQFVIMAGGNGTEDPPGTPSGPQGPGQHGSPGPNGNSGP